MENKTLKELSNDLWKRGFFLKGYYESGIKLYRIWDTKKDKVIMEDVSASKIKNKMTSPHTLKGGVS